MPATLRRRFFCDSLCDVLPRLAQKAPSACIAVIPLGGITMMLRMPSTTHPAGRFWLPTCLFVVILLGSVIGAVALDVPGATDSVFVKGYGHLAP